MNKPKILKRTQFGNPILRTKTQQLRLAEIKSDEIQELIEDIKFALGKKRYGIGLAANQVGRDVSLAVIDIKPTPARVDVEQFTAVIINPTFVGIGRKYAHWEGCISMGSANSPVFAKTMRYKKIKATWHDEAGKKHREELSGLPAHVFQHETDHLNGILFPERVKDHTTWMNASEYKKHIKKRTK